MNARAAAGWRRLWAHSYRLGLGWLVRDAASRWRAGRTGWVRFLVPLDPWRYYEMGRVADQSFSGDCLDVSSPKLLTSLLQREGSGTWTATDLFSREIDNWRRVDPSLNLEVQDATRMTYADESFDSVLCLSVLEHIGAGADALAVAEMWRVLRPGGVLHLTTDVATTGRDVFVDDEIYGEASTRQGERVFFKRDYAVDEIDAILHSVPWASVSTEYAVQRRPWIESRFYAAAPWSYVVGPLLRWVCPRNFVVADSASVLRSDAHGVIYAQLVKPTAGTSPEQRSATPPVRG